MDPDKLEALRARVAKLPEDQRIALRKQVEAAGIAWDRVAAPQQARSARPERLPLSPAQAQFWLLQQVTPHSTAATIAFSWIITGPINRDALRQALRYLVARHAPLRSCFPSENGVPWQASNETPFEMTQSRLDPHECATAERAFVGRPFDLAHGPVFRAHLISVTDGSHRLMMSLHHIVADGWSRGILVRELAAAYRAFCRSEAPALPPLACDFADLVQDQHEWLQKPQAEAQRAFWRKQLEGIEVQSLPGKTDSKRLAYCETLQLDLDPTLATRLAQGAAALGATPFMVALATFKLLMHRYTGQTDLAVGTPTAGRSNPDAASTIGLLMNTLVLRSKLDVSGHFTDWLKVVQQSCAQSFDNHDLPFASVVDSAGDARRAGQTPLFQTLFQMQTRSYQQQNAAQVDLGDPALQVEQALIPLQEAKFDLSWHLIERETGLTLIVEYRTGQFEAGFIHNMVGHFQTLLCAALTTPAAPISQLEYMTGDMRCRLAATAQGRKTDLEPNISARLADHAQFSPHAPALVCGDDALSYGQLETRVTLLARKLRSHPAIPPDGRVVVALERSIDLVVVLLAAMRAGVAYVPLDPAQPEARKAHILRDAQANLVISETPISGGDCACLSLVQLETCAQEAELAPVLPDGLAYIIYTSGTTGAPKGVPITHRSLANLISSATRRVGLEPASRFLALTTVGFDIAGLEMFAPLAAGGTVVLADRDTVLSPPALGRIIRDRNITHMQATPALWRTLVESGWQGSGELTILCGGEALDAGLARQLIGRGRALWNMYGPTETTIWSAALEVKPWHLRSNTVAIGDALDNTGLHILDRYGQDLPMGIPGELAISGAGLSPGYWNRPDLTAEKFINTSHGRTYLTGDNVVRGADGLLCFQGRMDYQIKLNGFRIEPGEIEALLVELGMAEALVVLDDAEPRLIAYCRAHNNAPDVSALKTAMTARLPGYMVPGAFVFLDQFELNTNGKIDRSKLPTPDAPKGRGTRAPQTDAERVLHKVWCGVLEVNDIGVEDNFFDLGGASVSAMQIVSRARDEGLVLQPAQLFEHQTIAAQAAVATLLPKVATLPLTAWQTYVRAQGPAPWLLTLPVPPGGSAHLLETVRDVVSRHHELQLVLAETGLEICLDPSDACDEVGPTYDLGAWARASVGPSRGWRACVTSDNRLALAAHPVLFDAASTERLALLLGEHLRARLAGQRMPILRQPELPKRPTPSQAVASSMPTALPSSPAQREQIPKPVSLQLSDKERSKLVAAAKTLERGGEAFVLAALAQTLGQWGNFQRIDLDLLEQVAMPKLFGNHTRLLALSVPRAQGGPAHRVSTVARAIAEAAPPGIAPRTSGGSGALMSWRAGGASDIEWLSRPECPQLPGYALYVEADMTARHLNLRWSYDHNLIPRGTVKNLAQRHLNNLMALCLDARNTPSQVVKPQDRLSQLKAQIRQAKS